MKKSLLFAILAFSMNAFAQNSFTTVKLQHSTFNPKEIVKARLDDEMINSPGINSRIDFDADRKQQHLKGQRSLIQINDSIYHWYWDTGWMLDSKDIGFFYDKNNNPTCYINQLLQGGWWSYMKYNSTYDDNNNLTDYFEEHMADGWIITLHDIFTYDANNNLTS